MTWEGLTPPYSTIVADPPWEYPEGWPPFGDKAGDSRNRAPLPYSGLSLDGIKALPVADLAADDAHLYLWTTNRYLRASYDVVESWGFTFSTVLVWAKPPMGVGPGGAFSITTEFVLYARRGKLAPRTRHDSTWFTAPRGSHSEKPPVFADVVERVSPGPYVELFARQPRLGWDHWGHGYEGQAA